MSFANLAFASFASIRRDVARPTARAGYRPDIDGLRAVAVLAVVAAHAGVPGCAGGFVGVDVFFVISGYLIAGNLARSPLTWRAFLAFYGRRMRRTLPALHRRAGLILPGAALSLALAAVVIVAGPGWPGRFPADVAAVASFYDYADRRDFREGSCFLTSRQGDARAFDRATCLYLAGDRRNVSAGQALARSASAIRCSM